MMLIDAKLRWRRVKPLQSLKSWLGGESELGPIKLWPGRQQMVIVVSLPKLLGSTLFRRPCQFSILHDDVRVMASALRTSCRGSDMGGWRMAIPATLYIIL